ncbi:MAG: VWA domain-containing protein [Thermoprotei archaeon]|nr:VWA domain-containing protein [Thermoprotei archaeon]
MYGRDYSIALDISLSMGDSYSDMIPSKLSASREALALLALRVLDGRNRMALVLFHERPIPLLPPTGDYKTFVKALSEVNFTDEGSALGDGIVEAVKMLRGSLRGKTVIALTDGGVTGGVPVRAAALYAKYSGVKLSIVILGGRLEGGAREDIEAAGKHGAEVYMADSRQRLQAIILGHAQPWP